VDLALELRGGLAGVAVEPDAHLLEVAELVVNVARRERIGAQPGGGIDDAVRAARAVVAGLDGERTAPGIGCALSTNFLAVMVCNNAAFVRGI
jgi:hypothetical protein